jgi:bacterioferritin-associated ferredoxin
MILCICRAISEADVDAAVERGARTWQAVEKETGAGTDCGTCHPALVKRVKLACAKQAAAGGCAEVLAVGD